MNVKDRFRKALGRRASEQAACCPQCGATVDGQGQVERARCHVCGYDVITRTRDGVYGHRPTF